MREPKYKTGDVAWRTASAMHFWPQRPEKAYSVVVVVPFFDDDVSDRVHYVHKVFTHIDNYFDTIEESVLFPTAEEAEKDSERRYHAHKRNMAEMKKRMAETAKGIAKQFGKDAK